MTPQMSGSNVTHHVHHHKRHCRDLEPNVVQRRPDRLAFGCQDKFSNSLHGGRPARPGLCNCGQGVRESKRPTITGLKPSSPDFSNRSVRLVRGPGLSQSEPTKAARVRRPTPALRLSTADPEARGRMEPHHRLSNHVEGECVIHGELLKLGFELAQSSVAKYMDDCQRLNDGSAFKGEDSLLSHFLSDDQGKLMYRSRVS